MPIYMRFGLKEAIEAYILSGRDADMAVHIDETDEVIAVGKRGGKIVPILKPDSTLRADDLMQKAGIASDNDARPKRGRVNIRSRFPTIRLPSARKTNGRLH